MTSLAAAFAVSLSASLLLTPWARRLAWRIRAFDHGDGQRKLHPEPVPLLGGLALYVALLAATLVIPAAGLAAGIEWPLTIALLCSAGAICLVGCLDDFAGLRVRWKLLGQVMATLPLVLAGFAVERVDVGGLSLDLGWLSVPLTIGWLVTGANALNFLDGMDALASVVGLVIAGAVAVMASALGHPEAALLALILAGGLAGFLFYNWQPATIYLGDAGSMLIGLWLSLLAIEGSQVPGGGTPLLAPLALMSLPIADMGLAIVRRTLAGKRFWIADRAHVHHRLLDRGFGVGLTIALLAGTCLLAGGAAYAGTVAGYELASWCGIVLLFACLIRLRLFGDQELALATQAIAMASLRIVARLSGGRFARDLPSSVELDRLSPEDAWASFVTELGLHRVERLEITLGSGHEVDWRARWGLEPSASAARQRRGPSVASSLPRAIRSPPPRHHTALTTPWTLKVRFDAPGGGWCGLRARVRQGPATHPLNWLSLLDLLALFGRHWAAHPERAPRRQPHLELPGRQGMREAA